MQPDGLPFIPVQTGGLACPVKCAERVPTRLRLAARRREDERVRVYPICSTRHLPRSVVAQLADERRQQLDRRCARSCLDRDALPVTPELAAHGQRPSIEIDVAPAKSERLGD